ncbi:MAG: metal ABC transporter permease [Phycisphaerales bacterium]
MRPFTSTLALSSVDWWTIAIGVCCCVACGTIGCYLVLRRMSMLGDAISHAILPGLAGGFLLSGSRDVLPMLAGAAAAGLATASLSAALTRVARVAEDASLGVVFTTMFALGVILLAILPSSIDLDPSCVLYGSLELAPLSTNSFLGFTVPDTFPRLAIFAAINVGVAALFAKEIKIVAFDAGLAATMGISAGLVHGAVMALVAATSVVSFEAVGSVLVVAMLIAPGATAHLLTDRFGRMFVIAGVAGTTAAVGGYLLAVAWNSSVAGMISVVAGAQFALAALAAPRHGVLARVARQSALALRIAREDALGMLFRWHEHAGAEVPLPATDIIKGLERPILARLAIGGIRRARLARRQGTGYRLTPAGFWTAGGVVRSHRLWEVFLAQRLGLPLDHLHAPSHRAEHFISPEMRAQLARELGVATDPHGRPIPEAGETA